jgi:KaiC/GvpD/RAD55 family RecA-like ATPase
MSIDFDEIEQRLTNFENIGVTQHYKPLSEAADAYVQFSQNPDKRIYTGITQLDAAMRGVAPGEFCIINGFAHNGKTILAVELLIRNRHLPMVFFTPDETRPAVLVKLTAATTGIGAEELERRIHRQDKQAIDTIYQVAEEYKNLFVFDENVTLHTMDRIWNEVCDVLGDTPAGFIFDYAHLLREDLGDAEKLDSLKSLGKRWNVPAFALHQSSRSKGAGGAEVTIDSGAYGGEQQATFLIGVRRKINYYRDQILKLEQKLENTSNPKMAEIYADRIHEIRHDLIPRHVDTITVNLIKNKRPPSGLVPDIDFRLDSETGRMIQIDKDDPGDEPDKPLPLPYTSGNSASALLKPAPAKQDNQHEESF